MCLKGKYLGMDKLLQSNRILQDPITYPCLRYVLLSCNRFWLPYSDGYSEPYFNRLIHSLSLVVCRLSSMRHGLQLTGMTLLWLAYLNIGRDWLNHNGLRAHVTGGDFYHLSAATDSPPAQPWWHTIYIFHSRKKHLNVLSAKWRPFCLSLNELKLMTTWHIPFLKPPCHYCTQQHHSSWRMDAAVVWTLIHKD